MRTALFWLTLVLGVPAAALAGHVIGDQFVRSLAHG